MEKDYIVPAVDPNGDVQEEVFVFLMLRATEFEP